MIGGDNPILVQSMTNTSTNDIEASARQAAEIASAGAGLVRLTTQGSREASNLRSIREQLKRMGCDVALSADVHFNPAAAFEAVETADKVRINPGNFPLDKLDEFIERCKARGISIRLGVNHGSLSGRMMEKYGDTPRGMVESAMEFLDVATRHDFHDIVISIKASNTVVMVETVRLLASEMDRLGMDYPLHLGVTEAGDAEDGRIKSAVGIGALLLDGLGDTIRVSLSEPPQNEVPVARLLVSHALSRQTDAVMARMKNELSDYLEGKGNDLIEIEYDCADLDELRVRAGADFGWLLMSGYKGEIRVEDKNFDDPSLRKLEADILQAARRRFYKTEFIACPSCGRTLFDLQSTLKEVKEAVNSLGIQGLKVAVMGCIVNGPGEMADADFGYVGAGPGRVSIYKGKEMVKKNIPATEALPELLRLITETH